MTTQDATAVRAWPMGKVRLTSGLAVTCAAVFLYATALSRAIAVWISPLGAALFVTGLGALRTGRQPRRALLVALGVVAVALVVLGLWTLFIAIQAEDQAV